MQGRITFARELHRDVKTQMLGPDMGDYVLVTTAESDVKPGAPAGAINGGFFPKKPDWPAQYRRNPLHMIAKEGLPSLQWSIPSWHHVDGSCRTLS